MAAARCPSGDFGLSKDLRLLLEVSFTFKIVKNCSRPVIETQSAFSIPGVAENDTIKCPCAQCRNYFRHIRYTIEMHLCRHSFKEDYETWTEHGEGLISHDGYDGVGNREGTDEVDQMDQMLVELAGHHPPILDAEPSAYAKAFYRMVASADELVHDRTTHSRLSAIARLFAVKSRYNMFVTKYDDILGIVHELLPPDSKLPNGFYQSKKLLEGLGMQYIKIDVCYNNCMLFYKDNKDKDKCDFCGANRRFLPEDHPFRNEANAFRKNTKVFDEAPRCIQKLRKKVRNKDRVEAGIVEAFLVEEAANTLSIYFRPHAPSVRNKVSRYDDCASSFQGTCDLDIFKCLGRCMSPRGVRELSNKEYKCLKTASIHNALFQMSYGYCPRVRSYGCYDVNGYRFRSKKYGSGRVGLTTINSGVCVTSFDESDNALEYYGIIEDIIKIEWEGSMKLELVLFYCSWFDPTPNGLRCIEDLGLVEINHTLRLSNFNPFVMASQITQVYYLSYPCKNRELSLWWVVYHVAPHGCVPMNESSSEAMNMEGVVQDVYQADGLDGAFVIDLSDALDSIIATGSDEVTDLKDLEAIQKQVVLDEEYDEEVIEEEKETEEDDEAMDEEDEETYDPNDF
ncbi:unnamed protein product [Miscanthus lutarioriparius]|uniref:Uncharacterized protein n=1 Tax=Miscanthus lutarioriparius TaxID=422564 RepID=A0A811PHM0_9POAL|nr:unnamed protein product [Miscanthus lutarioriparius]